MLIFEVFPPVRKPLVATFSETRAVTSPEDIVKNVWKFQKHEKSIDYFGNLVQFLLSKTLRFEGFFASKMTNGG